MPGPPQQERPPDLGSLRATRGQILAAASQRGLRDVRVFGSVARGEAVETSDVDLLVAPGPDTTLFDLSGFALDVEEIVGRHADVATPRGLKARIRDRVRRLVRDDRERLADVVAAIDRIRRYVQDDRTRFDTDELLQSAVLHWIEIIGEAARGVGDKVRTAHPEVPWRVITGMRNRVSHGYFDIDLDVVWNTVTRDLPKLQESVTRILAELDSDAEDSR